MPSKPSGNVTVLGLGCVAVAIANCRIENTGNTLEEQLNTPEAARGKRGDLNLSRGAFRGTSLQEVLGSAAERLHRVRGDHNRSEESEYERGQAHDGDCWVEANLKDTCC